QAEPGEGRARVRAGRPAWRVFPQWAGPRGVGGTRAYFAESWLDQRSWSAVEELFFEALPGLLQSVPGEDGLKARGVERRAFDELEQASLVLGATGLERDGSQMLGGEDARGRAGDILLDGLRQRFLDQRIGGRKKLHRPSGDDDVFAVHVAATRLEVVKDGLRTRQQIPGFGAEVDEDVHVERGHGFKIEGRADSAADGVAFDDAIGMHLIDGRDGILDVHTFIVSRASCSSRELQLARRPVCRQRCCRAGATFATSIKRTTDKRELGEFIAETPGETAAPRRCGEGEVNSHHHESFSFRIDSSKLRRAFSSYLCVAPISCA